MTSSLLKDTRFLLSVNLLINWFKLINEQKFLEMVDSTSKVSSFCDLVFYSADI